MAPSGRLRDQKTENIALSDPFHDKYTADIESDVKALLAALPKDINDTIDESLLIKGARLAKDYGDANNLGLSKAEVFELEKERKSSLRGIKDLFSLPQGLQVTIMTTACAAIALGWQQSAINTSGVNLSVNSIPGVNTSAQSWVSEFGVSSYWIIGLVNALPMLSGSLIGTLISDPLQGFRFKRNALRKIHFGRRFAMMLGAMVSVACCIWSYRCTSWQQLMICRILLGIGIGTKASVAPIFAAEAAMEKLRGRILMMWQLFDAFGIMLGFVTALIAPDSWRVQLGCALIPSAALMILVLLCPESPRLLIKKRRYKEAYKSLRRLRRLEIQAARDFYLIHVQLQAEVKLWREENPNDRCQQGHFEYQDWIEKKNPVKKAFYLILSRRNRKTCLVAFLVMASQQLCGINILAFYSSNIFRNTVQNMTKVNLLNFGFGTANFLFTLPSFFFIDSDSTGRRGLLLFSFLGMAFSLLIAGLCFGYVDSQVKRLGVVIATVIVGFTGFYSVGAGPVPFTLSAEIFSLAFREVGMSFSVMVNFFGLGLLVLFIPKVTTAWGDGDEQKGQRNVLLLFMGLNFLMLVLLFFIVPSTEGLKLEEMTALFDKPTKERVGENITEAGEKARRTRESVSKVGPNIRKLIKMKRKIPDTSISLERQGQQPEPPEQPEQPEQQQR